MPDQNNTNQNQDQPSTTTAPPVPPVTNTPTTTADTPMPDFQNEMTDDVPPMPQDNPQTTSPAENVESIGSAAPSDLPDITASAPKKKFGGGKVIATILGILLLVGGVGAGIMLTQQRQLFQQQARTCVDADCALTSDNEGNYRYERSKDHSEKDKEYPRLTETQVDAAQLDATGLGGIAGIDEVTGGNEGPQQPPDGSANGLCRTSGTACDSGLICSGDNICRDSSLVTACRSGNIGACNTLCGSADFPDIQTTCVPPGVGCNMDSSQGSIDACSQWHWTNCVNQGSGVNGVGCDVNEDETPPGDDNNPTPTPGPTASCQNIKAYSDAWVLLTADQLSALEVDDQVNFCVLGVASAGTFDMARFTINGSLKPDTTTKRPGTTDFCQSYTIPAATTAFNVSAQIHHATLGWK